MRRQRRREKLKAYIWRYGAIYLYMDVATPFTRYFNDVFVVASCLLSLANIILKPAIVILSINSAVSSNKTINNTDFYNKIISRA